MANRFDLPLQTPVDATGAPYPGGKLFFYQSGTTTKLNTYSDEGLTIANSNPVVLDSAGRYPNAIFLQNLPYKVVLAPSTDSDPPTAPIWTQDPVYTSDYSTIAQVQGINGSPNGQLAGTAASATIPASMAFDYTNDILYVCTESGTATTAVWTAINASSAAAVVTSPQGYLTPTSGTPIITGDVAAATAVYYTPYKGVLVPIYNGTSLIPTSIVTELQYTLTSSLVASNIYDLFVFSNSGVPTLGSGPSWSAGTGGSITAGSCARGTGAGGAALSRVQGILTNAVSMTIRYGDGTQTIAVNANMATYVGSIFIDGTNGQVSCYRSYGQSRKWGIWNAYNRQNIVLQVGDSTSSWSSSSATWEPSNADSNNKATVFCGLAEEETRIDFWQNIILGGTNRFCKIGIGVNSTSSPSGFSSTMNSTVSINSPDRVNANHVLTPALGINNVQCIDIVSVSPITFNGQNANMLMTVQYMG